MTFLALLLGSSLAASTAHAARAVSKTPAPQPLTYLKIYSLAPFKEHWTLTLKVRSLAKARDAVLKTFSEAGAVMTHSLESFPSSQQTQQLSYTLSKTKATAVLKKLRKVGSVGDPRVLTSADPVDLPEIQEKLGKLEGERAAHVKELESMPAISALVGELIHHLAEVRAVYSTTDAEVLLNMTIEEKR